MNPKNGEHDDIKTFIVTQMINPSYFVLYNPNLKNAEKLEKLEENLKKDVNAYILPNVNKKFSKHHVVAYYWSEGKRYIRCQIDDIITFNYVDHYFLFALDYGVSIFTTSLSDIHEVSELFKFEPSAIMDRISLSVLPATTRYDYVEEKECIYFCNKWCELAIKLFKEYLSKSAVIKFEPSDELLIYKGFTFGDLKLTTYDGRAVSLCKILIDAKVAMKATSQRSFNNHFDRVFEKKIERWNDNSKTGGILKQKEGKLPLYYEDEILMKDIIVNCEAVQLVMCSVQKVRDWQEKNEMYANMQEFENESDLSAEWDNFSNSASKNDEGFDETINSKRKPLHLPIKSQLKFGVEKPNQDEIGKSMSQSFLGSFDED